MVHCLAGRSRSVAIVLAYMMHTYSYSLDEAYDILKARKPGVAPGLHFLRQLQDYEKHRYSFGPSSAKQQNSSKQDNTNQSTTAKPTLTNDDLSDKTGSSGCSTPLTSISSFDQPDQSGSSYSGGNNASGNRQSRNTCHSLPSVDSAFTDDKDQHSQSVFVDDVVMKDR